MYLQEGLLGACAIAALMCSYHSAAGYIEYQKLTKDNFAAAESEGMVSLGMSLHIIGCAVRFTFWGLGAVFAALACIPVVLYL